MTQILAEWWQVRTRHSTDTMWEKCFSLADEIESTGRLQGPLLGAHLQTNRHRGPWANRERSVFCLVGADAKWRGHLTVDRWKKRRALRFRVVVEYLSHLVHRVSENVIIKCLFDSARFIVAEWMNDETELKRSVLSDIHLVARKRLWQNCIKHQLLLAQIRLKMQIQGTWGTTLQCNL